MFISALLLCATAILSVSGGCIDPPFAPKFDGLADLVTDQIPGVEPTFGGRFIHYSGYLESVGGVQLHYWFFESKNSPENDPLVLWLNGGPGCSSMLGALTELGPIRLERSGRVSRNQYSWNKNANVLFLESPAGVGFSYNASNIYQQNDTTTVELNVHALRSFYKKFPQYKNNRFFIAGESYAGVYIPTLAQRLLKEADFKLNGILIGNGYLNGDILGNALVHFHYYHGLMKPQKYRNILEICCQNVTDITQCRLVDSKSAACRKIVGHIWFAVPSLNIYNIFEKCNEPKNKTLGHGSPSSDLTFEDAGYELLKDQFRITEHNDGELSSVRRGTGKGRSPPCVDETYAENFLNDPQTKKALHISEKSSRWAACRDVGYDRTTRSTEHEIRAVVDAGVKVLIYAGDTDTACNFIGNAWFVERLGYPEVGEQKPWYIERQVAGFKRQFGKNLFLTIVHGAGHMVPENKPAEALEMFQEFIKA